MIVDKHSAAWLAVAEYVEARLLEHRTRLEGNLSWDETICTRAQMKELRILLAAVEPEAVQYVSAE